MPKLSRAPALPVSEKARAQPNAFSPANETSVFSAHPSGFEGLLLVVCVVAWPVGLAPLALRAPGTQD